MKALLAPTVTSLLLWAVDSASAQNGHMTNGGMGWGGWMGGYGGFWGPLVLVGLVGLVGWIVVQKRK